MFCTLHAALKRSACMQLEHVRGYTYNALLVKQPIDKVVKFLNIINVSDK